MAQCAGYKVDRAQLDRCLALGTCAPALGDKGLADALAILETAGKKALSQDNLVPRLPSMLGRPLEAIEKPVGQCAKKGSRTAVAECLISTQLGAAEQQAWKCVRGKSASQVDVKTLECAAGKAMPAEVGTTLQCMRQFATAGEQAMCATTAKLPNEVRDFVDCQRKHKSDAQAVSLCVVGKQAGGDAGEIAICVQKGEGDWAKGVACYASNQKLNLPPAAAQAIGCAQTSSSASASGMAACMATANLPDDLRRPAQCLAESGGDPLGAGACMASDGLTPDQRIAMQCLATTGGEPTSFATCAGGRLLMKEAFNCVDKKLFEGNCMGPNNDLRRFVEGLFPGEKLTENTVVGQVLNVPLDVIKAQVALAQAAGKGLENLVQNIGKETERAAANIGKELEKGVQNVGREAGRIGEQAKKDVNNGVSWVEGRTGVRLPRF